MAQEVKTVEVEIEVSGTKTVEYSGTITRDVPVSVLKNDDLHEWVTKNVPQSELESELDSDDPDIDFDLIEAIED